MMSDRHDESIPNDDPHGATETLRAGPALADASGALVLLHGRNAPVQEIMQIGLLLDLPDVSLMAPAAAGGAWYPHWYASPIETHSPWLDSALRRVDRLVEECYGAGLRREQIGLLGFSQGTCVALEYLVRRPERCSRVVGLSGAMVGADDMERTPATSLEGTHVFLGCGAPDPYFPVDRIVSAVEFLANHGARVDLVFYKNIGHAVSDAEIGAAREFLSCLQRPGPI
jgi:phospholipase/carboxylesterase